MSHVCLAQRVWVPSRYSKLVKVKVTEPRKWSLSFFEPDLAFLEDTGLMVEDSIISQGKEATLVVSNPNRYPVALEGGRQIRGVQAASWTCDHDQGSEDSEDHGQERGLVQTSLVSPASNSKERVQQLMQNIDTDQLDPPIRAQLEMLLQEFHDVRVRPLQPGTWLYRHCPPLSCPVCSLWVMQGKPSLARRCQVPQGGTCAHGTSTHGK